MEISITCFISAIREIKCVKYTKLSNKIMARLIVAASAYVVVLPKYSSCETWFPKKVSVA